MPEQTKRAPATHSDIVALYQAMLGRDPESDAVFEAWGRHEPVALARALASSPEFTRRTRKSPFFHAHSMFDLEQVIRRHALANPTADPDYFVNFQGVKVPTRVFARGLSGREGKIDHIPVPSNWHADMAEWGAALRAVELAKKHFTVIELGCGWGCWLNNAGVAARNSGLSVELIGVEGDAGHVRNAEETAAANGFKPTELTIYRAIAAAREGTALFERVEQIGEVYGLEPIFNATPEQRQAAIASGKYDEVTILPLADVIGDRPRIDLLHIDIQGGEADLIRGTLQLLKARVAYIVIGTHSREIEGRLFSDLLAEGWRLEVERPAILGLTRSGPQISVDGVQGWRNMHLSPE